MIIWLRSSRLSLHTEERWKHSNACRFWLEPKESYQIKVSKAIAFCRTHDVSSTGLVSYEYISISANVAMHNMVVNHTNTRSQTLARQKLIALNCDGLLLRNRKAWRHWCLSMRKLCQYGVSPSLGTDSDVTCIRQQANRQSIVITNLAGSVDRQGRTVRAACWWKIKSPQCFCNCNKHSAFREMKSRTLSSAGSISVMISTPIISWVCINIW